jgi:predicted GNAT family N-acyltransferase
MRIELGDWHSMRRWAEPLRFEVFVEEQNVPAEIELDSFDALSVHAVAFAPDGEALGTGRLLPDGHIGRMAVKQSSRGSGIGSAILAELMNEARHRGHREAALSAQTHAVAFYRRHGYTCVGDVYDDAGIPHINMICPLHQPR